MNKIFGEILTKIHINSKNVTNFQKKIKSRSNGTGFGKISACDQSEFDG